MKLLDRLVLKDLVPQFLVGIAIFTSLYFMLGPLLTASRYISQGFPAAIVVRYVLLGILPVLGLTFPMGMLLSVLLGFGRMSSDSETVALFAGGIPFLRVTYPAALLGLVVSGMGFILNDPVASWANNQILNIKETVLHQPGDFARSFDLPPIRQGGVLQATVHVEGGFSADERAMHDVTIVLYDNHGSPMMLYHARSAHPRNDDVTSREWELEDVSVNGLGPNVYYAHQDVVSTRDLKVQALTNTPSLLGLLAKIQGDPNAFAFLDLRRVVAALKAGGLGSNPDVRFAEFSLWNKIALPLASLVFALVSAPLALRPQRTSKQAGWVLSLIIIMCYYIFFTLMSSLARGGVFPPVLAAFLPDVVGLSLGLGMVWKRSVS